MAALVSRSVLWSSRSVCRRASAQLQSFALYPRSLWSAAPATVNRKDYPKWSTPPSRTYSAEPDKGYGYLQTHEWAKVDGNTATIGISNYAQEKLGDVVFVELPEIDSEISKEDAFCVLESVKAAVDVHSPLSGKVTEINSDLVDKPGKLNTDPYGSGWIVKLLMTDTSEFNQLLSPEGYKEFLKESI